MKVSALTKKSLPTPSLSRAKTGRRTVRSYVRREGRMTRAQRRALKEWLPIYQLPTDAGPWNFSEVFDRNVPLIMEIGFGDGGSLLQMAAEQPECDFVGVEVYRPGVGRLLMQAHALGLTNLRVVCEDATDVLLHNVPHGSLTKVLIFFPDPWPKKRQQKRRLLQTDFVRAVADALVMGGQAHMATDSEDYAQHMLQVLATEPRLSNTAQKYAQRPSYRVATKYERRGEALGHSVWDLIFKRVR